MSQKLLEKWPGKPWSYLDSYILIVQFNIIHCHFSVPLPGPDDMLFLSPYSNIFFLYTVLEFLVFLSPVVQILNFKNNVFFNYTDNYQLLRSLIAVSQIFTDTMLFKCHKCPLLFPVTKHLLLSQTMCAEEFLGSWTCQAVH